MSRASHHLISTNIPQAPNLRRIRRIVSAIVEGHSATDAISASAAISQRHVGYIFHAAQTIGLIDVNGAPTAAGLQLVNTIEYSEDESVLFRRCIEGSDVIRTVAPDLLSPSPPTKNEIALRIQRITGLGKSTAEHRAGDLLAWRIQLLQRQIPIHSVNHHTPALLNSANGIFAPTTEEPAREYSPMSLMPIEIHTISEPDRMRLLDRSEGHFLDFKSRQIAPGKLTRSVSAFANADGGELLIGITEAQPDVWIWDGFSNEESANAHIQCFDATFALGNGLLLEFLRSDGVPGLVLRATIQKTRDIKRANDGISYIRRGAQNLPVTTPDALRNLERAKGIVSFEDETIAAARVMDIANSNAILSFMLEVIPNTEPELWLQKQQLLLDGRPAVAGVLLFAEEPQVFLPKTAVKIYRYRSSEREGTRESLVFDPIAIEGPLYDLVSKAVSRTVELTEQIQIMTDDGLRAIQYPHESLHEIITNALLHRDYALNDDVHVRIFDNRIEVESPGRLPAHITPSNILRERFARNPKIVRLINKFPNPPNKDVGEGLNTAFRAMKKLRLREPQISERENSVLVALLHERLASPEQQIIEFARENITITNAQARATTGIESEVKVRALFQNLVRAGELEQLPGTARATTAYRLPPGKR